VEAEQQETTQELVVHQMVEVEQQEQELTQVILVELTLMVFTLLSVIPVLVLTS
jgi:hypothetical protein